MESMVTATEERTEKRRVDLKGKTVLVTGSPGFIGASLVQRLLTEGEAKRVISFDSVSSYYDPALKRARLKEIDKIRTSTEHLFIKGSIERKDLVDDLFRFYKPDAVVNLAAQAGVRYSIDHPDEYISTNITGFFNILEACRAHPVEHLVYASSSSVYGGNRKVPFSTDDNVDHPVSLYAATKKSNELMAHCYSKLYNIPATGLRFFTVYGPYGRPDMFYYSAAEKLTNGGNIKVFNHGVMMRDFTYIDDITEGIYRVLMGAPVKKTGADGLPEAPHAIYNIGGGQPEDLMTFLAELTEALKEAGALPERFNLPDHIEYEGMQPGDVTMTYADSSALERDYGFTPKTSIHDGLRRFAEWYANYNKQDSGGKLSLCASQ